MYNFQSMHEHYVYVMHERTVCVCKVHTVDYEGSSSEQFSKAMQIGFLKEMTYNQNFIAS